MGLLAFGSGFNIRLLVFDIRDSRGNFNSCCGNLNCLLVSAMLGELNAISTSLGTSIFDASSNKESNSLFEIVSNLSSVRPSMSIKLSSGTGTGATGVMAIGFTGRMVLLTIGSIFKKSSNPDDEEDSLPSVAALLKASAKMSSLFSSIIDNTSPYQRE